MTKYLLALIFATQVYGDPIVEKFQYQDHDYLKFECKTVLHDPDCHKCRFQRFVSYDPYDIDGFTMIERFEVSPFRYCY